MDRIDKLANIELLLLDVDGILTDGRIHHDDNGVQTKCFDVRDGHGMKLLQRAGVHIGFVTGRQSQVVEIRAKELGVTEVHQGIKDKLSCVREILAARNIGPEKVAFVGDDLVDLPVMLQVGFSATVSDAHEDVLARAQWVIDRPGGRGAIRLLCEEIIKARGKWEEVTSRYFEPEPL